MKGEMIDMQENYDFIPESWIQKYYVSGVDVTPQVNLLDGLFSVWNDGEDDIYVYSKGIEETEEIQYQYFRDLDVWSIYDDVKNDNGFWSYIGVSTNKNTQINFVDQHMTLFLTSVQQYRGIFHHFRTTDTLEKVLKDVLGL